MSHSSSENRTVKTSVLSFVVDATCLRRDKENSGVRVGNHHRLRAVSPDQKVLFVTSHTFLGHLALEPNFSRKGNRQDRAMFVFSGCQH